jgi:POT family proton-dependent oligopeptide transporter
MLIALVTYVLGARYLPPDEIAPRAAAVRGAPERSGAFRARFALLIGIMLAVVVFRGAYEQNGNSIALWTDEGVNRAVTAHFSIPMTWFQSINPLLIFLLTPVYVVIWTRLARHGREPSSIQKMVVGAIIVGLSYIVSAVI